MTNWKPVTREHLLDALNKFAVRDNNAVDSYKNGCNHGIESAFAFTSSRLEGVMNLLAMTVRHLTINVPTVSEPAASSTSESLAAYPQQDAFIPEETCRTISGLSRSERWRRIHLGTFPPPVNLGKTRCSRWSLREVSEWVNARLVERDTKASQDKPTSAPSPTPLR